MIALLNCFINLSASNHISPTGEQDSVLVSYKDLRTANSKLLELDYVKQINNKLYDVVRNDSIIIKEYQVDNHNKTVETKKYKTQRNVSFYVSVVSVISFIVSLIR